MRPPSRSREEEGGSSVNVVLLVVDSLRFGSIAARCDGADVPFMRSLSDTAVEFRRAYATECWTLPSHVSMFTGALPSRHGAHFGTMEYRRSCPTAAEILAAQGYATDLITRNSIFDGTLPGVTRGFQTKLRPLASMPKGAAPLMLLLALAKPRVRRLIRRSGFFHAAQKSNRSFLATLARMGIPADAVALDLALQRMSHHRRAGTPYFLFVNLYDVHAPYAPSLRSPFEPWDSVAHVRENVSVARALPKISNHSYLRPGFAMPGATQRLLAARYRRAIELMDGKLRAFATDAARLGLLDDTIVIITSDHGEAFGEHGLYLHDASVYDEHLRVPLWIVHPRLGARSVDDVVSTKDLFGVILSAARGGDTSDTILDFTFREQRRYALAEHFHYPHDDDRVLPQYRHDQAAIVLERHKVVRRAGVLQIHDLSAEGDEGEPRDVSDAELEDVVTRSSCGRAAELLRSHLRAVRYRRAA